MTIKVDLNSDMGEGFGPWKMGDDAALLDVISSANIACGFHAGDPDVMANTMRLAVQNDVGIGAHPGFADLKGFGRRRMKLGAEELQNLIAYQLGAARGIAASVGTQVRHFKLHGALSNMCSEDAGLARLCYEAALRVDPDITLMVLCETAQQSVAQDLGANWAGEIFADRAYEDDATLVDRSKKGAVLDDADAAAERILLMLQEGAIIASSGKRIPAKIDTVCLHGDTAEAVSMARALRAKLTSSGVEIAQFG
ncbi:5-oxoprolinase subunit PxpA [Lentibacter algarum]|uniref:LamB/YcsF family protein n=1 Tax=Lentibacter algarum TaxID=576131 RepID=UPI001C06FAA5|nr:5-oxoprolinase subunit PxpA [Lentibacter algarum]MBU2980529.1 5-oxoprolinase subunit PxpA [Lentibacter algarum]